MNDYIYVASTSLFSGDNQLNAIVANADLTDFVATDTLPENDLTRDISKVKIAASELTLGKATLSLVTSASNPNPNNLFVTNISHPSPGSLSGTPVVFETSTDPSYLSPVGNDEALLANSSIALTKMINLTKGHLSENSTPGDANQDATRELFFLNYMTENGTNTSIKHNAINSQAENIMSNTPGANQGAFPALIKN